MSEPTIEQELAALRENNDQDYEQWVMSKAKDGGLIASNLTASNAHLIHMAIGIAGESGELLDAIKKAVIYGKPLDRENVIEELGDLEFYMAGLRAALDITREQVIAHNVAKLEKRYAKGYSDKAAQERADKA